MTKVDILVFAAHPDDAELACSGIILNQIAQGNMVAIVDLTQGEMGTRGTVEDRFREAQDSSAILGVSYRENLGIEDVYFQINSENRIKVVEKIRKYQPKIVLANAVEDRHPDHGKAALLVKEAIFWSGLTKLVTKDDNGNPQTPHRPDRLYHYIQSNYIEPDVLVDVSEHWDKKIASIRAFKTQFFDPNSNEPETFISSPEFLEFIQARARVFGQRIGVKYAEGLTVDKTIGVKNLMDII
jgi:N-acetylglucosamine malate deacetylase 1